MCDICHSYACPPGCPNYEPPDTADVCPFCGEHIARGDEVIITPAAIYHKDCFDELAPSEALGAYYIKIQCITY